MACEKDIVIKKMEATKRMRIKEKIMCIQEKSRGVGNTNCREREEKIKRKKPLKRKDNKEEDRKK